MRRLTCVASIVVLGALTFWIALTIVPEARNSYAKVDEPKSPAAEPAVEESYDRLPQGRPTDGQAGGEAERRARR